MPRRNVLQLLCAIPILAGCAGDLNSSYNSLFSSSARSAQSTPSLNATGAGTLYLNIVDGLIKQGRDGAALAFLDGYDQSRELPTPRYWLLRGNALLGLRRGREAADAFSELQGTSLAADGWNGLGHIAADAGDWLTADGDFHKAVAGDPANADFLNNLAFADLHIDKTESAVAGLQQAHELNPGSSRILMNLIIALTAKGDVRRADTFISNVKDGARREKIRALVKSAGTALHVEGKS